MIHSAPTPYRAEPALLDVSSTHSSARRWMPAWIGGLSALVAFVPVGFCPACWPAYFSILSSLGFGTLASRGLLGPLAWVLLSLAVGPLAVYVWKRRNLEAAFGMAVGIALIVEARWLGGSVSLSLFGVLLLIVSALWATRKPLPPPSPRLIQIERR